MIYFVQPIDGGPVKIGHSVDVAVRIRQLENHFGRPLVLLGSREGDRNEEQAIHARFAHLRLSGPYRYWQQPEQFQPAPELMGFIGRTDSSAEDPETVELMLPTSYDPSRQDVSVKFDKTLAGMARMIALSKGVSLAEYISEAARANIEKDFGKEMERFKGGGEA